MLTPSSAPPAPDIGSATDADSAPDVVAPFQLVLSPQILPVLDNWHLNYSMLTAIVIGGVGKKPNNPFWALLFRPYLRRTVFSGRANLSRMQMKKDSDFKDLYDHTAVLVTAYFNLRRDHKLFITDDDYCSNADLAAIRDFFEEWALLPMLYLSTFKLGGDLDRMRARILRALVALHCTNYAADQLQAVVSLQKLKDLHPEYAQFFDDNAMVQMSCFIERMHARVEATQPKLRPPTLRNLNIGISAIPNMMDADVFIGNLLGESRDTDHVYQAKVVDETDANTVSKIRVAQELLLDLINQCKSMCGSIRQDPVIKRGSRTNEQVGIKGWSGGRLGFMPARLLLSPRKVVTLMSPSPSVEPVAEFSEQTLLKIATDSRPEWNSHLWRADNQLYIDIPGTGVERGKPKAQWDTDRSADVVATVADEEGDDGDLSDENDGETRSVRLNIALKRDIAAFLSPDYSDEDLTKLSADEMRDIARNSAYYRRRTEIVPAVGPDLENDGVQDVGEEPVCLPAQFEWIKVPFTETQDVKDTLGPESDVISRLLHKYRSVPPSARYGSQNEGIELSDNHILHPDDIRATTHPSQPWSVQSWKEALDRPPPVDVQKIVQVFHTMLPSKSCDTVIKTLNKPKFWIGTKVDFSSKVKTAVEAFVNRGIFDARSRVAFFTALTIDLGFDLKTTKAYESVKRYAYRTCNLNNRIKAHVESSASVRAVEPNKSQPKRKRVSFDTAITGSTYVCGQFPAPTAGKSAEKT
jgi:hypothetical protein